MTPEDYDREWRQSIASAVTGFNSAVANLLATLERVNGRLDQHEFRIKHIEESPAGVRQWLLFVLAGLGSLMAIGGCFSMIVGAILGAVVGLASLAGLVLSIIQFLGR